jgi:hypothetical protein
MLKRIILLFILVIQINFIYSNEKKIINFRFEYVGPIIENRIYLVDENKGDNYGFISYEEKYFIGQLNAGNEDSSLRQYNIEDKLSAPYQGILNKKDILNMSLSYRSFLNYFIATIPIGVFGLGLFIPGIAITGYFFNNFSKYYEINQDDNSFIIYLNSTKNSYAMMISGIILTGFGLISIILSCVFLGLTLYNYSIYNTMKRRNLNILNGIENKQSKIKIFFDIRIAKT